MAGMIPEVIQKCSNVCQRAMKDCNSLVVEMTLANTPASLSLAQLPAMEEWCAAWLSCAPEWLVVSEMEMMDRLLPVQCMRHLETVPIYTKPCAVLDKWWATFQSGQDMQAWVDIMKLADYWAVLSLYWRMMQYVDLHGDALPRACWHALLGSEADEIPTCPTEFIP